GLGRVCVSSLRRVPRPPARMTAFTAISSAQFARTETKLAAVLYRIGTPLQPVRGGAYEEREVLRNPADLRRGGDGGGGAEAGAVVRPGGDGGVVGGPTAGDAGAG